MKFYDMITGVYLLMFNTMFIIDVWHHRLQTNFNVAILAIGFILYYLNSKLEKNNRDNKS